MNALIWIVGIVEFLLILPSQASAIISETNKDLQSLSSKIDVFKADLHRVLEGARVRKKRQIKDLYDTSDHQMRVGSAAAEDLPYLSDYKLTFWTPVEYNSRNQVLVGTQEGHLILFEISDSDDRLGRIVAVSYEEKVATKAKAFTYFDEQWFVVLQSARNQTWIRLYLKVGRGLEQRQSITLAGETDFDIVTVRNTHYLAVTTYQSSNSEASLALYHWTQTQFDLIDSRTVYGPRSLACWVLDGTLYIVLAQRVEGASGFRFGSPVYLYNAKDDRGLVLQQMLSIEGPIKVLHFYVSLNHYVIFIGSQNAAIYWWSSNQFLLWQTIEGTAHATDASILTLANGEVLIVIALKEEVLFATLDSSGHYIISFTMSFSGFSLSSFQFMFSGKAYYALALFAASYKQNAQPIWKLTLDPYFVPTGSSLDSLRQCLNDVSEILEERQGEMNNIHVDLNRVWVKNKDQKITAEVFVAGNTTSSRKSTVSQVLVVTQHELLPESSLTGIDESISKLKSIVSNVQHSARVSVRKSIQQNITGILHFRDSLFIPSLNLKYTSKSVPINGVPVSRIDEHGLRTIGDQKFSTLVQVANIFGNYISTTYINGIEMSDFLLLKTEQTVTGSLTFSDVQATDLFADTVNSIPVDHLVTTFNDQTIRDLKSISHLSSLVISVPGQINGEILREINSKIMRTHTEDEMMEHFSSDSVSYVKEDIFLTGLINGQIDLSQMLVRSVTKDTIQDLTGRYSFDSPVTVVGHLASDYVNNVDLSQLVTLSTNQIIHGNMVFKSLSVQGDLTVETVNDLRLREDAVLKILEPQFVTGLKTFSQEMIVDFIDMTEYVTIDGVDPSLLVQNIVKHKEGVVDEKRTVFHNAIVLGNLTALEGINGRNVLDLPNTVWLKTAAQDIEVPVTLKKISVEDDMEVQIVNTIHLDDDLVQSFGDSTIISVKHFEHNVVVSKDVATKPGAMINGMDIISFKTELDDYVEEGTVHGRKTLSHLEIYGDLDAATLNNFEIFENIMQPHAYQEISVPVAFPSELTIIPDTLLSDVVWFNTFNSMDLRSSLMGVISKTGPNQIITGKVFSNLQAKDLSLPKENSINGILIAWLLGRVVTLDTPQQISSEKSFLGNQHWKKAITAKLNGKELSSMVKEVVFVDDKKLVSNKEFIGSFKMDNVFLQQPIDGIDMNRMSQNVFYKSKDNDVKSTMIFMDIIDIGKLFTDFTIDETKWSDLVFTNKDESLGPAWLMTNTNVFADVFITGLVNGCDILQLEKKALYTNKTSQFIQEEVTIESIEVLGNVNIEDVVNEVPVQDLIKKLILVTGDQIVTSDVILETGVEAANLNVDGLVDHFNLPYLMSDAARRSLPQDIHGYKKFNSLTTDILDASNLFISGHLDNVSITELYNRIVWKKDDQVVEGEKIFQSLRADVATVEGHLNGLSLPNDIVKTDTSEHITSPISFMSDLILASSLSIKGKLDGVNISSLVQDRLTLTTNQNVFSPLSFQSDVEVHGDLKIDGTVNDVVLEMVSKIISNIPLEGYKVFIQNLPVLGSLNASTVNGYNIQLLEQNILKQDEEEFLKDLQVFEKPLKVASHLFTDLVNSISLSEITSTFFSLVTNFNNTLSFLEDMSNGFLQQLTGHVEAVGGRISRFAYFTLVQEINLGPTMKILQGYRLEHSTSDFSHSMVIWTSQKHCSYLEKCCHEEFSHWMRVTRSGHLMVDSDPEPGRLYPIHNPAPVTTDKDFFIWTNATGYQPKWCGNGKDEKMLIASFTDLKYLEVFLDVRNSPSLSDIKSFRQGHLYAVAGFYYDKKEEIYSSAVVYLFNEVLREWTEHQILPSYGVLSLDITYSSDELLLAVGTGMDSHSSVYKWDDVEHEFILLQNIPTRYVTSTLWIKHRTTQLLALANVEDWPSKESYCSDLVSGGEINIYNYDKMLKWSQSIPLSGVVSLVHFNLEGDTFLAAASSKHQTIYIYELRGFAGFSLIQSMFVGEVTHLNTYRISNDIYMTVATASGPAKVLKVVLQGKHTITTTLSKDVSLEDQKDEARKDEKAGC